MYIEVAYISGVLHKIVCWEKRLGLRRVAKCGFCTLRDTYKYGYFKVMLSGKLFRYSRENIVFYLMVAYISGTLHKIVCWVNHLGLRRVAKCGSCTSEDT